MKGVYLRIMAMKAMEHANRMSSSKGARLYNLWQRLNVDQPVGAYADFRDTPDSEYLWRLYISDETLNRSQFRDSDRIKLTEIMINQVVYNKKLVQQGYLVCEFNFHNEFDLYGEHRFDFSKREDYMEDDEVELQAKELFAEAIPTGLTNEWKWLFPPVTKVRNYFGEKIAFYVHYLSFTTILLIIPAIIGIPAFVLQEVDEDEGTLEQVTNAIFAFLIVCWATTYYEFWKREEVKYTVIWGQLDFEEDQVERVDFHGIWRRSPVDDRREIYFSLYRRLLRIFLACLVTLFMIA